MSKEKKQELKEYKKNRYHNMSKEKKQELKKYIKKADIIICLKKRNKN